MLDWNQPKSGPNYGNLDQYWYQWVFREWISPASVSYILHKLVEEGHLYSDILNTFTFYISPRCTNIWQKELGSDFIFLQHQPWWIWVQQKLWQNVAKGMIGNVWLLNKLWASTFMILITDSKPSRWTLPWGRSKQELGAPLGRQGPPSSSHILSTWSKCHPINHHHCTMR